MLSCDIKMVCGGDNFYPELLPEGWFPHDLCVKRQRKCAFGKMLNMI